MHRQIPSAAIDCLRRGQGSIQPEHGGDATIPAHYEGDLLRRGLKATQQEPLGRIQVRRAGRVARPNVGDRGIGLEHCRRREIVPRPFTLHRRVTRRRREVHQSRDGFVRRRAVEASKVAVLGGCGLLRDERTAAGAQHAHDHRDN
jgi:hypothetical protein